MAEDLSVYRYFLPYRYFFPRIDIYLSIRSQTYRYADKRIDTFSIDAAHRYGVSKQSKYRYALPYRYDVFRIDANASIR